MNQPTETIEIGPQPGRQSQFLASDADLTFYGGGAGGGKTYGELLDLARWANLPRYRGVLFRLTRPQIMQEGGLWDESLRLYPLLGGVPSVARLAWKFPSGAAIGFKHCQYDADLANFRGLQADVIAFDQLEEFTAKQFWYLLSRNRGSSGVKSYIRATYNPQPGWLADLLQWWWDAQSGYAIPERAGVVRWMCRIADHVHLADTRQALDERFAGERDFAAKSVTFIPATADDNPINLANNPDYKASLLAMRHVDKERLLKGNHLVRDDEGREWPAEYFQGIWQDGPPNPDRVLFRIMGLDPAVSKQTKSDFSAFVELTYTEDGLFYVDADIERRDLVTMVDTGLAISRRLNPICWALEVNGFQALEQLIRERGQLLPSIATVHQHKDKIARIRLGVTPYLASGRLRFRRSSPGAKRLVEQLSEFPLGEHDDGPDALEMTLRVAGKIIESGIPNPRQETQMVTA